MRILGVDIASHTGYCVLDCCKDSVKLESYGSIDVDNKVSISQRLHYLGCAYEEVLIKYKPDVVSIEDVIMGMSGPKIMVYLSRFSGVILEKTYKNIGDNIRLYTPVSWKASSFPELNSFSKKYKILLEVCHFFEKITHEQYMEFRQTEHQIVTKLEELKDQLSDCKKQIKVLSLKKNNPPRQDATTDSKNKLKHFQDLKIESTRLIGSVKKLVEKDLNSLGKKILHCTDLTYDIADSVGVAYCCYKEIIKTHV